MRLAAAVIAALLAASAALAEGGPAADAKKGAPGNNVELPFLMAPMRDAGGKLDGYAYISSLLVATGPTDALAVRDKLAFLQDAFVRDVNAAPVAVAGDPGQVDIPAIQSRLLADARHIMGARKVRAVLVCTIQIAPLHPKQTPDLYTPPENAIPQAGKNGKPVKTSPCDA
jgi:hypothetical protein